LDGLQAARSGGAESVFLAVDSRNSYARDVYRHAGFVDVAVRAVHVRFSRGRASGQ
jgi:ribosomal protein S18 acetylase RimI-like enzyme